MKKFLALTLTLAGLIGCAQKALETAANINLQYAQGLAAVQATARRAHESNPQLLNDANYRTWLELGLKLNQGGQDVNKFLRAQSTLDPAARASASSIIANLAQTVQNAISQDLVKISDPTIRSQISVGLSTIQTSLNSATLALAAGGN